MLTNTYNHRLPSEQVDKFTRLIDKIGTLDNSIPLVTKSVFNFKGRKSEKIARIVINELTNDNSYVCDPFMGTGTFPIASTSIPRKTLGIELDNYTYSVVTCLLSDCDISTLNTLFNTLKANVYDRIMELYATECCGKKNYIKTIYFDPEPQEYYSPKKHREIKNGHTIKLYNKCPICGSTSKTFSHIDELKIKQCNTLDVSNFPSHKLIENSRINITSSTNADTYDANFSVRNKYALLTLQEAINSLPECKERDLLEHALVASLTLGRIAQYGSGSEYIYQVMRFQAQDMNIWYLFESKVKNFIKYRKAYLDSNYIHKHYLETINGDYFSVLSDSKFIGQFDLIYTDPPYTDQVPYLERGQLYRDWLNIFYYPNQLTLSPAMLSSEVVVTNAPSRSVHKTLENYYHDIDKMFNLFYKITTASGVIGLTLNLGKDKYFRTLSEFINKARKNGFEYVFRCDLTKNDPSLRKQAAYGNTLSTEMLIFFVKLPPEKKYWYIGDKNIELDILRLVYALIQKNQGITLTTAIKEINSHILHTTDNDEESINKIRQLIKEQFIIDKATAMIYVDPDKLYLSIEDNTTLFTKLYDIVPILINNLLSSQGAFSLDDLYFEISNRLCSGDPYLLKQLLEDPQRELHIKLLIENYCDIQDNKYVKKNLFPDLNSDAIDISVLEGYTFEKVIKQLLLAEGFYNVVEVGGAGDRGVDLRAKKINPHTNQEEGYIFQCKRWIANVGGEPIQRLHSMWMQYPNEFHHATCITTSDYTQQGKREAQNTNVKTINGVQLIELLNKHFPGQYYHGSLDFNII